VRRRNMESAQITEREWAAGLQVTRDLRVAIFVVAYNAEAHVRETLRRIPPALLPLLAAIYVIDDSSSDATSAVARELQGEIPQLEIFTTPYNQGYGGNQKLGYRYARLRGFDVVVLLHGDGQYAPEVLPRLLAPFADPKTAAVFGSRMLTPGAARRGGMPAYKRLGNRILTFLENRMLGSRLSEFHSGYRAYRVDVLAQLPIEANTNDFHFDTEIIIQLLQRHLPIVEVPIPTYYGDEICRVNGLSYAVQCLRSVLHARATRLYLVYHPKFDVEAEGAEYRFKQAPTSLHQFVLARPVVPQARVLELGAGQGDVGAHMQSRGARVVAVDRRRPARAFEHTFLDLDLDGEFVEPAVEALQGPADEVVALDVLEHLADPERGLERIKRVLRPGGTLLASTGNVAYLPLRLSLALGQFNYGKKGILDLTHSRLFTIRSFKRLLVMQGFRVERVRGFGPPIQDMIGDAWPLRALDRFAALLARLWPSLFGYQFAVEATRLDDVDDLLARTLESGGNALLRPVAPAERRAAPSPPSLARQRDNRPSPVEPL
jgi:glycosyltransferase involved in cell wall biosynthesis